MAFDDSFRERLVIGADDVKRVCGIHRPAEIYDLVGISPDMAEWIDRASRIGHSVVPRQIYNVRLFDQYNHRVGWFYHSRPDEDYVVDYHHIACDCVGEFEAPEEAIDEMLECPAVLRALDFRAARVAEVMGNQQILELYGKPGDAVVLRPHAMITAKAIINFMMNYEKEHPEGWIANVVSGEHQVPLLGTVLQITA